jgi:hypothetical protein
MTWRDAFKFGVGIAVGSLAVNAATTMLCKLIALWLTIPGAGA